jgi:hypothetical protein
VEEQLLRFSQAVMCFTELQWAITLFYHFPEGRSLEASSGNQYKLSYEKKIALVFVIRKKSRDRLLYKSSRI